MNLPMPTLPPPHPGKMYIVSVLVKSGWCHDRTMLYRPPIEVAQEWTTKGVSFRSLVNNAVVAYPSREVLQITLKEVEAVQ